MDLHLNDFKFVPSVTILICYLFIATSFIKFYTIFIP